MAVVGSHQHWPPGGDQEAPAVQRQGATVGLAAAGVAVAEAVHDAAIARFRPIILTSITTIAGLMPLLLETSLQAQILIPLAGACLCFWLLAHWRRTGRSDAEDAGIEMLFHSGGELKAPPPETVFLHRKLVGSFLACARIRARVRVQDLIQRHL